MPRIRRATARDVPLLVEHRRRMWADMGRRYTREQNRRGDRQYRRWLAKAMHERKLAGFILEEKSKALASGCVWLQPVQPNPSYGHFERPYLLSMYTVPQARGRGFARRIVREAERWSKRKGFPTMSLHASRMGRPVYAALGYARTWEMRRQWEPAQARPSRGSRSRRGTPGSKAERRGLSLKG